MKGSGTHVRLLANLKLRQGMMTDSGRKMWYNRSNGRGRASRHGIPMEKSDEQIRISQFRLRQAP